MKELRDAKFMHNISEIRFFSIDFIIYRKLNSMCLLVLQSYIMRLSMNSDKII